MTLAPITHPDFPLLQEAMENMIRWRRFNDAQTILLLAEAFRENPQADDCPLSELFRWLIEKGRQHDVPALRREIAAVENTPLAQQRMLALAMSNVIPKDVAS